MNNRKADLYRMVAIERERLKIDAYPFDIIKNQANNDKRVLELVDFHNKKLNGMAFPGEKVDTIVLDKKRARAQLIFDYTHEHNHLSWHKPLHWDWFQCFEKPIDTQDGFREWQCNEGAAELLMPYELVLPIAKEKNFDPRGTIEAIMTRFQVTEAMAFIRLDGLDYELIQYVYGTSVNSIELLSKREQVRRKLRSKDGVLLPAEKLFKEFDGRFILPLNQTQELKVAEEKEVYKV